MAALRAADVAAGTDPRTHYYGLVRTPAARTSCAASRSASRRRRPSVVASGPAGVPGPGGFADLADRSYADGTPRTSSCHTFGRFHPGFPPGEQDASDPAFPSSKRPNLRRGRAPSVGFDVGDPVSA